MSGHDDDTRRHPVRRWTYTRRRWVVAVSAATSVPASVSSSAGKLVYLALDWDGPAAVEELTDRLDMKRVDLFGILGTLRRQGIVERDGDRFRAVRA